MDWGQLASIVVGGIGLLQSEKGAQEARRTARTGEQQLGEISGLDLAEKQRIATDLRAIMTGDYTSLEPAFRALDENVEAQLKDEMDQITVAERKGMRLISNTVQGAAKLRLLKNLAETTQDNRAKAIAAARKSKVTTREGLKSEITQYARQTLPTIFSSGAALSVPTSNVQLGLQALLSNAQATQAQMKYLTDVLNPVKTSPSIAIYNTGTPSTVGYTPTTTSRKNLTDVPLLEQLYKRDTYKGGPY